MFGCPRTQRTLSWGQRFANSIYHCWDCVFFPFNHPGDFYYGCKGKSASLRIKYPQPLISLNINRGNFYQRSLPGPQFGKGQPWAYATKGEHTFCMEDSHGSLALGTLFPIPSTIQPQIRQDNTEGVECPSVPSSSWAKLWWHCLNEILLDVGDANEPDHLCLGYIWAMAANLLLFVPFYGQGEYELFSEPTMTREGNISLCCVV